MNILLHRNPNITPRIRREIRQSKEAVSVLAAKRYGLTGQAIRRWKGRDFVRTHLIPPNGYRPLWALRKRWLSARCEKLLLSVGYLLVVTREVVNADVPRLGLGRCFCRHGVSRLSNLKPKPERAKCKTFKDYQPGYVHVYIKYLPQLPDQDHRTHLFGATGPATRWVYMEIKHSKSAASAKAFLNQLIKQAPFNIKTLLTDNDKTFTNRVTAQGSRAPSGDHIFGQLCAAHETDHRLIPIRRSQTNGIVERFNGRIAQVLAATRFRSGEELSHYVYL